MQCESMSCRSSVKEKAMASLLPPLYSFFLLFFFLSLSLPLSFSSAISFGIRIQIHTDCGPMCRNAIELHEIEFAASCCRLAELALRGSL